MAVALEEGWGVRVVKVVLQVDSVVMMGVVKVGFWVVQEGVMVVDWEGGWAARWVAKGVVGEEDWVNPVLGPVVAEEGGEAVKVAEWEVLEEGRVGAMKRASEVD